jgi:pimeloyl-ACP methyl ester carboxylesterase
VFEPRTDRLIQLADGRNLAFTEWGDLDGPTVAFFHGTPHSRLWCPDIRATEGAGVHLIVVDRPGYGRSDAPDAEFTLRDWTNDMVQLADTLRVDRFGVIGWSGGATYAAACAAVIPDRLTGAGEVGGAGWPVDEQPGALGDLSEAGRRVYELARTDRRAALRLAGQLAAEWIEPLQEDPASIMDESDPPQDLRHFDDPAWAANFYDALRESIRPGPGCYAWDEVAGFSPWGFELESISMPFHVWHGAHDPHEQMSSVNYWAARISGARVRIFDDSGHFAVVDHWGEMLSAVAGSAH